MNVFEAREKIDYIKRLLLEMREITQVIERDFHVDETTGEPVFTARDRMSELYPEENKRLVELWEKIQKNVPPGYSFNGNLIRHLSYNQVSDWSDIYELDIPREFIKINEFHKRLTLIEYLESLHPMVSRATGNVLNDDIDAALKVVYSGLDSYIRSILSIGGSESTAPYIGKAFKDGFLIPPKPENLEGVRNFLMGVIGYYRHVIVHNYIGSSRRSIEASLSLFALAHEAFLLLDRCSKHLKNK